MDIEPEVFRPDILQEILIRLPLQPLIQFTAVCKSWRSLIKSQSFVCAHRRYRVNSAKQYEVPLILLHKVSFKENMSVKEEVYSVHYDKHGLDGYSELELPIGRLMYYNAHLRVVGTCNGLICLADDILVYGHNFFICNPFIRKYVTLPKPCVTGMYDAVGFGFDAATNDYKVVRLITFDECDEYYEKTRTLAEVYSLSTGSWSNLGIVAPACKVDKAASQAFVNGSLYWPVWGQSGGGRNEFLLAFNVGTELFRAVSMPEDFIWFFHVKVSVFQQKSLALFAMDAMSENSCLNIWVMKEDGISESWSRLITLGRLGPEELFPWGLCFTKSDEVLLFLVGGDHGMFDAWNVSERNFLASLDIMSKQSKIIGSCEYQYTTADPYEENLLLLDKNHAASY